MVCLDSQVPMLVMVDQSLVARMEHQVLVVTEHQVPVVIMEHQVPVAHMEDHSLVATEHQVPVVIMDHPVPVATLEQIHMVEVSDMEEAQLLLMVDQSQEDQESLLGQLSLELRQLLESQPIQTL
jgi:hypothetical protein